MEMWCLNVTLCNKSGCHNGLDAQCQITKWNTLRCLAVRSKPGESPQLEAFCTSTNLS